MKWILILLVLLVLVAPSVAFAQIEEEPDVAKFQRHIADRLSGPAWLHFSGLEPRSSDDLPRAGVHLSGPRASPQPSELFSRNVLVSGDFGIIPLQNEPAIAVNPKDPDNLVIGSHDYSFGPIPVAYASFDGGVTWSRPALMKTLATDALGADPSLAFDREGNVYYSYMSFWSLSSIVVSKSTDGGLTWSEPVQAAKSLETFDPETWTSSISFVDKPIIATGPDPQNMTRDVVYVSYTEFMEVSPATEAPFEQISIKLVKSVDGGSTFSEPITVATVVNELVVNQLPPPPEAMRVLQGSMPAVGPDGILYVAYYDSGTDGWLNGTYAPTVAISNDAGSTINQTVAIANATEVRYWYPFRAWATMFPIMAVGPEGNVYAVFAENPEGPDGSDIMFSRSTDDGETWTQLIRVNDDDASNDQFFPWVAVKPDGTVHVIFGDKRDDPGNSAYHIYYASSEDGGLTFLQNQRVSEAPSDPGLGFPSSTFIGDYFMVAASSEDLHVVWTDSRAGRVTQMNQDILTARVRPILNPSLEITPITGPMGTPILLKGSNFAAHSREVAVDFNGMRVATAVTDSLGQFSIVISSPTSTAGLQMIRAVDDLGYSAEVMFSVDLGSDTIQTEILNVRKEVESAQEEIQAAESRLADGIGAALNQLTNLVVATLVLAVVSLSVATAALIILLRRPRSK